MNHTISVSGLFLNSCCLALMNRFAFQFFLCSCRHPFLQFSWACPSPCTSCLSQGPLSPSFQSQIISLQQLQDLTFPSFLLSQGHFPSFPFQAHCSSFQFQISHFPSCRVQDLCPSFPSCWDLNQLTSLGHQQFPSFHILDHYPSFPSCQGLNQLTSLGHQQFPSFHILDHYPSFPSCQGLNQLTSLGQKQCPSCLFLSLCPSFQAFLLPCIPSVPFWGQSFQFWACLFPSFSLFPYPSPYLRQSSWWVRQCLCFQWCLVLRSCFFIQKEYLIYNWLVIQAINTLINGTVVYQKYLAKPFSLTAPEKSRLMMKQYLIFIHFVFFFVFGMRSIMQKTTLIILEDTFQKNTRTKIISLQSIYTELVLYLVVISTKVCFFAFLGHLWF